MPCSSCGQPPASRLEREEVAGVLREAQDTEEIVERVAALDIGKGELACCVRVPDEDRPGRRLQEVQTYTTMTRSLLGMADHLRCLGVTRVVMESTGEYWKPPFYVLEAAGFDVWLVNARDVKHLPGRPKTDNPAADCIGVANDGREFALWLSPHILSNTTRVLAAAGVGDAVISDYVAILADIAEQSGGGVVDPPRTVHDCRDHEDNLVLDLAAEAGALLVVSDDVDLTSMSPWRGAPVLRPSEFASRVDAMRRARRRR